jgi:hypothetical protein
MKKLPQLPLLAASLLTLNCASAFAITPEAYKTTDGSVEISGLTPGDTGGIYYGGISKTVTVSTSGTCNYIVLRNQSGKEFYPMNSSNTTKIINDTVEKFVYSGQYIPEQYNISVSQLCNGTDRNTNLTWTAIGSNYVIRNINNGEQSASFYVFGIPKGSYTVSDGFPAKRMISANSCGIAKVSNTSSWPSNKLQNFYVLGLKDISDNQISWNYSDLPTRANNNLCRKGVLYVPAP